MKAVSINCENAFKHAHMRKTYKGVAELTIIDNNKNEEE
jgi:hypothetical protein